MLWHAPGAIIDPRLLESLRRSDVRLERCTNAYAAIRLVTMHATRDPSLAATHRIVLLAQPASLVDAAAVVALIPKYVQSPIYWVYEPGVHEHVKAFDQKEITTLLAARSTGTGNQPSPSERVAAELSHGGGTSRSEPWPAPKGAGPPRLRLAGDHPVRPASAETIPHDEGVAQAPRGKKNLLSDEELTMLLGES